MKRFTMLTITVLALALLATPAAAGELDAPDAFGLWMAGDGEYAVELAPCDEALCATVVWAEDEMIVGKVVLIDALLQPNTDGVHKNGEFMDPMSGKTFFKCELRVDDEGSLRIEGRNGVMRRGRVVLSRFPTRMHWTRVDLTDLPIS
jgi:uncharacterized protein (DUF2147 family)